MRYKLTIFIFLFLAFFTLNGCTEETTSEDIDYSIFIQAPAYLRIEDQILIWNEVDYAYQYVIYVNGEYLTTTFDTFYDFSMLDDKLIIFQVQTDALKGYKDSEKSLSIAYMKDFEEEIIAFDHLFEGMNIPEGFSEALVHKGMTVAEYLAFMNHYVDFNTNFVEAGNDIYSISEALQTFIDFDINIEALLYASLLVLPDYINDSINQLETEIELHEDCEINDNLCLDEINSLSLRRDSYLAQLEVIENDPDEILWSAMHSVDYFLNILQTIDSEFITSMNEILLNNDSSQLNADEMILLKDELVGSLIDALPSEDETVILFELLNAVLQPNMIITNSSTVVDIAHQVHLSIESLAILINTIDKEYFNKIIDLSANSPDKLEAEILILSIQYIYKFQIENQILLSEIRSVLTAHQIEGLLNTYLTIYNLDVDTSLNITSEDILIVSDFLFSMNEPFFDWFIKTDGEIIRILYQMNEEYLDLNETQIAYMDEALKLQLTREILSFLETAVSYVDEEEINVAMKLIILLIPKEILDSQIDEIMIVEIKELLYDHLLSCDNTLIEALHETISQIISSDLIGIYSEYLNVFNEYAITNYSSSYLENPQYYFDDTTQYGESIYKAKFIVATMSDNNQESFAIIFDEIFTFLSTDQLLNILNINLEDLSILQEVLDEELVSLIEQATIVSQMDPFNLDESQIIEIELLMSMLNDIPT